MKRIATALTAAALGVFVLAPCVSAQSWWDTQGDRAAIARGHEHLRHDRWELRNDVRNGDYAAAAREKAEMNRRRAAIAERREDLNNDYASRYYGPHHWRHHHYYYDED